jgi:hypothetical protein
MKLPTLAERIAELVATARMAQAQASLIVRRSREAREARASIPRVNRLAKPGEPDPPAPRVGGSER